MHGKRTGGMAGTMAWYTTENILKQPKFGEGVGIIFNYD